MQHSRSTKFRLGLLVLGFVLVGGGCGGETTLPSLQLIQVSPANSSVPLGGVQQFTATATFSNGTTQDLSKTVTWSSSVPAIATISSAGLASSKSQGSTTIQATSGTISGSANLTVLAPALVSIAVTPANASLPGGATQQFTATGILSNGMSQDLSNSVTWSSSAPAIATISSSGLASSKSQGSTTIQAISGTISGSANLTVSAPALVSIAVTPADAFLPRGITQQFTAKGTFTDKSSQDITGSVSWTASPPSVVSINSGGLASTEAVGTATIVATSAAVSGSTLLTVTLPSPPTVSSVYPTDGFPGESMPTVIIYGSNFQSGATCSLGADITVNSCTFNSPTQLTANLTVSPTATLGNRDVTVTNPLNQGETLASGFGVRAPLTANQTATFSFQPTSSGSVTVTLPKFIGQRDTVIVGVSFRPADITGVTVGEVGSPSGQSLTRGLAMSILHNVSGSNFYTNFYYLHHGYGGVSINPGTVTLNFSGGPTSALIAIADLPGSFGISCLDCQELNQSAFNESLTAMTSWSDAIIPTAFNAYLFAWGATEAASPTCSSPGNGWRLESQTVDLTGGATVCLLDQFVEAPGYTYQASVNASTPENYAMESAAFAFQLHADGPPPTVTSVTPSSGGQGQNVSKLIITGTDFSSKSVCSFGAGITVNSCTFVSSTELTASLTISTSAEVGPRNVTVTNTTNNLGGTVAGEFSVTP